MGLDGIVNNIHASNAIALEDSEVCNMPFGHTGERTQDSAALEHHVHRLLSGALIKISHSNVEILNPQGLHMLIYGSNN